MCYVIPTSVALYTFPFIVFSPISHHYNLQTLYDIFADYLLISGGNRVTIYSFHTEDNLTNFRPTKQMKRRQTKSTTNVSLLQVKKKQLTPAYFRYKFLHSQVFILRTYFRKRNI